MTASPAVAVVPIGEFSRLTHLSVKTLRHYHEAGLLIPYDVDPGTGYRRYSTAQVPQALLIGRLRALDMALPAIRRVLAADGPRDRDRVIAEHLGHMERELERTRSIVGSLRRLLTPVEPLSVRHERFAQQTALGVSTTVARVDIGAYCSEAFTRVYTALGRAGVGPAGPGSATYGLEFFTEARGPVSVAVPVPPTARDVPGLTRLSLTGGRFATATHVGPYADLDRTYAALGGHVAEHDRLAPGPIRERYLVSAADTPDETRYRTDICWPIAG